MQFWIIHEDPAVNAMRLPDMALRTNVREGYQILSDMGHLHGVDWPGQNKPYSLSHPTTRLHCVNWAAYERFTLHYLKCFDEAVDRGLNVYRIGQLFSLFLEDGEYALSEAIPEDRTPEQFMAEYLLTKEHDRRGWKQITDEETKRIKEVL